MAFDSSPYLLSDAFLSGEGEFDATAPPEAVEAAIKTTPASELQDKLAAADAETAAKYPAFAEIEKAWADAHSRALAETHATMRAEAASGDRVQRWWRPVYALELIVECVAVWIVALADLKLNGGKISAFVLSAQGLLTTYWTARFGVLGVYVGGRSIEKLAGVAGGVAQQVSPGAMDRMARALRRK